MEEQREKQKTDNPQQKEITIRFHIHQKYFEIKVPNGTALLTFLRKLQESGKLPLNLTEFRTISVNGKNIPFENGILKENPLLGNLFVVSLMKNIKGGYETSSD